jgi:hypothetical protein
LIDPDTSITAELRLWLMRRAKVVCSSSHA